MSYWSSVVCSSDLHVSRRCGAGTNLRPRSTQSLAACKRASSSHSMGVWLTTFKSCLWLHTSHSSGATLKSPTRMVGLSSCADQATIRSRKSILCPNLGFSVDRKRGVEGEGGVEGEELEG